MGPLESQIRQKIESAFSPIALELENESSKHGFSRGPEGHFKLLVVSDAFEGLRSVERHQKVFAILKMEMTTLHALAIRALTPAEYEKASGEFKSPQCAHRRDP